MLELHRVSEQTFLTLPHLVRSIPCEIFLNNSLTPQDIKIEFVEPDLTHLGSFYT